MTTTHFDSAYAKGESGVIFTNKVPEVYPATITHIEFRAGYDPASFDANNDFIYTTNVLSADGITYIKVPQNKFFANVAALKAYIDLMGL